MGADFWIVVQWWGTLFLVGAVAFPLTKFLFGGPTSPRLRGAPFAGGRATPKPDEPAGEGWFDRGYFFSKAVGMAIVTYIVYVLGMTHLAPFSPTTVFWVLIAVFIGGLLLHGLPGRVSGKSAMTVKKGALIAMEELFFFAALLLWSWVKGHEPSIRGLEKFMDYGFMQSILNSSFFPAADMWYVGFPINYYYFGHTVVAVLTKLSGIDLSYTFNLMLATIFALTATMSFSVGYQLLRGHSKKIVAVMGGVLTAWLVTLSGNMQTLYAFTRGYTGEDVQPFWQLLWPVPLRQGFAGQAEEMWTNLLQGMNTYWYANATRFIPLTIHEFPSYSFVVSDVHGHVLSLPFVLLAIGLLIELFIHRKNSAGNKNAWVTWIFYGLLIAILLMTNALDGPIYLGLFVFLFVLTNWSSLSRWATWKAVGVVTAVAALTSIPFLSHFSSFVSGVAVNCPPAFLADHKMGILLFEGIEKCQHSPVWMMYLLWGFFWFCGVALLAKKLLSKKFTPIGSGLTQIELVLAVFFWFSLLLIIFPEFFYFKDIYPAHFRSNTMFKLGYEAFILFSIVSGYVIVKMFTLRVTDYWLRITRKMFFIFLIPQLFLVSIYPIFSVRSYFDSLRTYKGLDGMAWVQEQYPDDYAAIVWLKSQEKQRSPVIIEADGDSYTDYARFSAFTGLPTAIGWSVHEWLWRGTYDVVAPRKEDVRIIYESEDREESRRLLAKYGASFIIVGTLEREKYPTLVEEKLRELGVVVFSSGDTIIYQVNGIK